MTRFPQVLAPLCALALLAVALPANAAPDCRGRLEFDQPYDCSFRSDRAPGFDGTLLFEEFDGNAFQATLDILDESSTAYCTCKAAKKGRFDRDKAFECVSGFAAGVAESIEGTVSGNGDRIDGGQIWSADPPPGQGFFRFTFACRMDDSDDEGDSDAEEEAEEESEEDSDGDSEDDDEEDGSGQSDRVVLCHKGKTKAVRPAAVDRHLAHGDTLGPCP